MFELEASTNFYVRCIKPNIHKIANLLQPHELQRQVKCAGLLEAIKIRKSGFALRLRHSEFLLQYNRLIPRDISTHDNGKCSKILKTIIKDSSLYSIGKTKVFLKEAARDIL